MRAMLLSPGEAHPGDLVPLEEDEGGPMVVALVLTTELVHKGVRMRLAFDHPDHGLVTSQFTFKLRHRLKVWR